MNHPIEIYDLHKTFANGVIALESVNLEIEEGEIFALLGPNGAGKTTLIKIICGLSTVSSGNISVMGLDIDRHYKEVRKLIGLVPQELHTDMFETVWDTVCFTRGLFGLPKNDRLVQVLLRELSLWEKRGEIMANLSGGMKRRVLIAKALAHEPKILFLDEPTAGVDVELRQDMWGLIRSYKKRGVTTILTTHFIDEAEELSDRVGIINKGKLVLVEDKKSLVSKLGKKQMILKLSSPISYLPEIFNEFKIEIKNSGEILEYTMPDTDQGERVSKLIKMLETQEIQFKNIETIQSSLEDIFVRLVSKK